MLLWVAHMSEKFLKPYNPQDTEPRIYDLWEKSGYFNPDNLPERHRVPFSMVLPPPNVTGVLHMGSALMLAIEDIIIRYKRMRGYKTLWIPGTDSAAIATQARVEKDIQKAEGKSRHDLGREELLKRINLFIEENRATILSQIRAMGSSLDWSRYAYTMDEKRNLAVNEAFLRMHAAGLIYRGFRLINWDPKGQTTISDDEIVYEERQAKLYTFKYSKDFPIAISSTRPETKVGDTAVAVHPDDERYREYVGKEYSFTFCDVPVKVKVVADSAVEPEFGTGALGVTPAHSMTDWEIADRHGLERPQIIDEYAKMTVPGRLNGKKTSEAREIVAEWLRAEGLLEKEEELTQNIATAERTGGIVEPLPKLQWFVDVNKPIAERGGRSLKELMRSAVDSGDVKFVTERFDRQYRNWIDNLRDWCISRQIWFGHRIPAWFKDGEVQVQTTSPGEGWEQDPDVLDTWFSSGLWTFSTLGWPENTQDLKNYHPTSLIETAYDIIFFWVARMIMMSQFLIGEAPFKTVYFHGIVRDGKGRKISKSLGNNIDPVDMSAKYGMDAVRLSLVAGMAPGTDSKIDENKIRGYKNFANKLWNISRFVLSREDIEGDIMPQLKEEFDGLAQDVTLDMENYRHHLAAEKLYAYIWHRFADVILEESKGKDGYGATLRYILENSLKLLHPFMPFVTEEIWQEMKKDKLLMIEEWPCSDNSLQNKTA